MKNIILFDGECNLCNSVVKFLIKHDKKKKFKFSSLQSEFGRNICIQYNMPTSGFETFLYLRNDTLHVKSTAALYMLRDLGFPFNILYGFMFVPRPLRDLVYMLISRNRHKLFKNSSCIMPTGELRARFIN